MVVPVVGVVVGIVVVVPGADVRDAYLTAALHGLFSFPSSARTCTSISLYFINPVSIKSLRPTADSSVIHTLAVVAGAAVVRALYFKCTLGVAFVVPAAAFFFFTKLIFASPSARFLSLMFDITGVGGMPCLVGWLLWSKPLKLIIPKSWLALVLA